MDDSTHKAVVESNVEELRLFANEIESTDRYGLGADSLKLWAFKLRTIIDILSKHLSGVAHAGAPVLQQEPSRGRSPSIDRPKIQATRRRESIARPRSEGGVNIINEAPPLATVAAHVASTIHMMLDTLCHLAHAEWSVSYIYVESTKKLVMIGGAGKRQGCPGEVSLHATTGVEHLVLENGTAVNMALASFEKEYSEDQDSTFRDHTKAMLIFPMFKPGSSSSTIGVVEVGNRTREGPFTEDEESAVADCAHFLANLVTRFPNDVTNPQTLDASIFSKTREQDRSSMLSAARGSQMIYRTGQHGQPRRHDLLRDAVALPRGATIENVLDHVARIGEAWKSAVVLNVELEHEIRRLHEALRISRRETARLQETGGK